MTGIFNLKQAIHVMALFRQLVNNENTIQINIL